MSSQGIIRLMEVSLFTERLKNALPHMKNRYITMGRKYAYVGKINELSGGN